MENTPLFQPKSQSLKIQPNSSQALVVSKNLKTRSPQPCDHQTGKLRRFLDPKYEVAYPQRPQKMSFQGLGLKSGVASFRFSIVFNRVLAPGLPPTSQPRPKHRTAPRAPRARNFATCSEAQAEKPHRRWGHEALTPAQHQLRQQRKGVEEVLEGADLTPSSGSKSRAKTVWALGLLHTPYALNKKNHHFHLVKNSFHVPLLVLKGIYHYWTYCGSYIGLLLGQNPWLGLRFRV